MKKLKKRFGSCVHCVDDINCSYTGLVLALKIKYLTICPLLLLGYYYYYYCYYYYYYYYY